MATQNEILKQADNMAGWLDTLCNPDMAAWRKFHGYTPESVSDSVMAVLRDWRALRDSTEPAPKIGRPKGSRNGQHKRKPATRKSKPSTEPAA